MLVRLSSCSHSLCLLFPQKESIRVHRQGLEERKANEWMRKEGTFSGCLLPEPSTSGAREK